MRLVMAHFAGEHTMNGVVLEEVRERPVVREVVHGNELDVRALEE